MNQRLATPRLPEFGATSLSKGPDLALSSGLPVAPMDSLPLLIRIARQDLSAVGPCLAAHSRLVWALAIRMTPTRADAEDAVQEIFAEVWRNAGRFDPARGSEQAFIATIARRRLIDRLRAGRREREQRSFEVAVDKLPTLQSDLETCVEARRASEVLAQLPAERRQVLRLSLVEGMSHAQIAEALSMPLGTVKSHARRGLDQVRKALRDDKDKNGSKEIQSGSEIETATRPEVNP